MDYIFAYAVEKARDHGYGSLTESEKWDWHGDIYGFRRVFCDASPDEHSSPCDQFGKWYDEGRAKLAENYYREVFHGGADRRRRAVQESRYAAE